MAFYYLARSEHIKFLLAFVLCAINKETAILLIPVFGFLMARAGMEKRTLWLSLAGLAAIYLVIKLGISWVYRSNPGGFVEFQLFRNYLMFTRGWTFSGMLSFLALAWLVFFDWGSKPAFYKISFLSVLPPLLGLALFLGFFDEWRGYYEAYPIVFGLAVSTLITIKPFSSNHGRRSEYYDQ